MDHHDPSPISWASRLRLLRTAIAIIFGQRLQGDIGRIQNPGLTLSPGRLCLKVRLLVPFNVLLGKLALRDPNYKAYSLLAELRCSARIPCDQAM